MPSQVSLQLPMPHDARAIRFASLLGASPADATPCDCSRKTNR
jgi:hypothetical protein